MAKELICKCGERFVWLHSLITHYGNCASKLEESAPSASTNTASPKSAPKIESSNICAYCVSNLVNGPARMCDFCRNFNMFRGRRLRA
jgi:hypothetical protein